MTTRINISDLGRRWGAVWAQRAIVEAVKSDGALPSHANASMASDFDTRVAEVGVRKKAIDAFAKAATEKVDRRLDLATRAMVV